LTKNAKFGTNANPSQRRFSQDSKEHKQSNLGDVAPSEDLVEANAPSTAAKPAPVASDSDSDNGLMSVAERAKLKKQKRQQRQAKKAVAAETIKQQPAAQPQTKQSKKAAAPASKASAPAPSDDWDEGSSKKQRGKGRR
jgi:hypothetical protein